MRHAGQCNLLMAQRPLNLGANRATATMISSHSQTSASPPRLSTSMGRISKTLAHWSSPGGTRVPEPL